MSQDLNGSYGKTMAIRIADSASRRYSSDHRNPQGLYVDTQGTSRQTQHGPRAGDELHSVEDGVNYGWPFVTYGRHYYATRWPLNGHNGHHNGYRQPPGTAMEFPLSPIPRSARRSSNTSSTHPKIE